MKLNFKIAKKVLAVVSALIMCLSANSLAVGESSVVSIELPSISHLQLYYALAGTSLSEQSFKYAVMLMKNEFDGKTYAVYHIDSTKLIPTTAELQSYTTEDLKSLSIPEKYRKIVGGRIVEMSAAEKAQVDSK